MLDFKLILSQREGHKHKLDQPDRVSGLPRGTHIPFDTDIRIFNRYASLSLSLNIHQKLLSRTRLNINHEGCVNTLQLECSEFYSRHGQDTRNQSSPSRFPCYYSPHNPAFVVRRYDLGYTKTTFLIFFTIPSGCFLTSCLILFVCSQVVGVRRTGVMAIMPACCGATKENAEREDELSMKMLEPTSSTQT